MWAVNNRLLFSYDYINNVSMLLIVHSIDMAYSMWTIRRWSNHNSLANCAFLYSSLITELNPVTSKNDKFAFDCTLNGAPNYTTFQRKHVVCHCTLFDVSFYYNNIIKGQMHIIKRIAVETGTMLAMVCFFILFLLFDNTNFVSSWYCSVFLFLFSLQMYGIKSMFTKAVKF